MTKVLALLTLAVLTFSAMTGPAFAQSARVPVRTYQVETFGLIRPGQPFRDYRWRNDGFYRGRNDALQQLPPAFRSPGFVDPGIFSPGR
jgi:hypothetical protein